MTFFTSLFRKTASRSHSKNIHADGVDPRARRSSLRLQVNLMDSIGRVEVSD